MKTILIISALLAPMFANCDDDHFSPVAVGIVSVGSSAINVQRFVSGDITCMIAAPMEMRIGFGLAPVAISCVK